MKTAEFFKNMTGKQLIEYADTVGVKVRTDRTRNTLKESKSDVIARLLDYEQKHSKTNPQQKTSMLCEDMLKFLSSLYSVKMGNKNRKGWFRCKSMITNSVCGEVYVRRAYIEIRVSKSHDTAGYDYTLVNDSYPKSIKVDFDTDYKTIITDIFEK